MDSSTRRRLDNLADTVSQLMSKAVANEEILKRFQDLERKIMLYESFEDLLNTVTLGYEKSTGNFTTLYLIDTDCRFSSVIEAENSRVNGHHVRIDDIGSDLRALLANFRTPLLRPYDIEAMGFLFNQEHSFKSAAICPLLRNGALIGSINLASKSSDTFAAEKSTDFLRFYCDVVAIAIENAMLISELRRKSQLDELTGINNRMHFNASVDKFLDGAKSSGICCLMIDVDKFKSVNDTYGHGAGDIVIREVAKILRSNTLDNELLARFGGEEFIVLKSVSSIGTAVKFGETIRKSIEEADIATATAGALKVTVSVGIATTFSAIADVRPLIEIADQALYDAKANGRNKVSHKQLSAADL
jgi:diguanylate cyclase (GGDEF)-like protein